MDRAIVGQVVATPDPPPTGIRNPIHDADGAGGAGYAGALVAGVRTYGWAAQTIVAALGPAWLDTGWADISLRRPLFAGERVTITLTPPPSRDGDAARADDAETDGSTDAWGVTCRAEPAVTDGGTTVDGSTSGEARVVLDGHAGLGDAPWYGEIAPPPPAPGHEPPEIRPTYDLRSVPIGEPLRPLAAYVKADAARQLLTDDLGLTDPRELAPYLDDEPPRVHPYFLAGRMAPLTRHNFTYGPTIHVRTQIQHRAAVRADRKVTVGAAIVDAYDRNDHWYQVLDGIVTADTRTADDGTTEAGTTLAVIRHHTIFRPRGTVLPEPIRSSDLA